MRITLVEDNQSLRKGITYRLTDDGHAVDALGDGAEAEVFLRQEDSDLVILDINLPGVDGLEILAGLRRRNDPRPVILLTARTATKDRVAGLDAGADDYLVKPFAMDELAARVRALFRRKAVAPQTEMALGPLTLNIDVPQLSHRGETLPLPRRELTLLTALALSRGRPLSKEQLIGAIYGTGSDSDDKVVEVYVSRLRKRLAPYGVRIAVARGIGYSLKAAPE